MQLLTDQTAIVGRIDPDAYTAAAYLTEAIALGIAQEFTFDVMAGTLGSSATIDFVVKGATSSGGSYTNIPGAAITQMAVSDKITRLIVSAIAIEQLGLGYTHIKGEMTVGTATSDAAVIVQANKLRYQPAGDFDSADVVEIAKLVT